MSGDEAVSNGSDCSRRWISAPQIASSRSPTDPVRSRCAGSTRRSGLSRPIVRRCCSFREGRRPNATLEHISGPDALLRAMDIDADHTLLQSLKTHLSSATLQDTYLLGRQFLNGGRDSRHWAAIHDLSPSSRVDGCGAEAIDAQNSREFIRLLTMYDRQVRPVHVSLVFAMIVAYCFPAFWLAALPHTRAHPSTLLRASLRRTVPSFTVEVRRRPRLAASPRDEVLSLESKVRPTAFERDFLRITAATFEPKTSNPLAGVGAASHPTRRILESLVPDKLPGDRLQTNHRPKERQIQNRERGDSPRSARRRF